jgi:hypothetical protein
MDPASVVTPAPIARTATPARVNIASADTKWNVNNGIELPLLSAQQRANRTANTSRRREEATTNTT